MPPEEKGAEPSGSTVKIKLAERLELGILASMWALDYVDDNGNIILINHHEQQRKEDNEHN